MKQHHRTELIVGIFLFIGLIVLGGVILRFGSFREHFRERYTLNLSFPDAGEIVDGSEVRLSGATIGRVAKKPYLKADSSGVVVELEIYEEFHIPEGSQFQIGISGLMGDSYISVVQPDELSGNFIPPGSEISGRTGLLSNLANSAEDISRKGKAMLDEVRDALKDLNSAIGKFDENILRDENLERFDGAMVELSESLSKLNSDVLSNENTETLKVTMANLRKTSENLVAASERVGEGVSSFNSAAAKAEATLEKADLALDKINGAIDDATEGEGLMAVLLNDAEMKEDVRILMSNLRRNGVLRYKDDGGEKVQPASSTSDQGRDKKLNWLRKR